MFLITIIIIAIIVLIRLQTSNRWTSANSRFWNQLNNLHLHWKKVSLEYRIIATPPPCTFLKTQRFHDGDLYHIDLQSKLLDWFLYDTDLRHEKVKTGKQVKFLIIKNVCSSSWLFKMSALDYTKCLAPLPNQMETACRKARWNMKNPIKNST